jgi:hypothetical protein
MNDKTYSVTATFDVTMKKGSLVMWNPDSVAAAVRQYLRTHLSPTVTKGGFYFRNGTIEAEAKDKEEVAL